MRRAPKAPAIVVEAAGLPRGERVLAHAQDADRWLLGTRAALVLVTAGESTVRLPWEQIQSADWERDDGALTVVEVGTFGEPRGSHRFLIEDPHRLVPLIRERVTASVVVQRGRYLSDKRGLKVIGRRSPTGGPISWLVEYDEGLDPDDPDVIEAADALLAEARADVGG